MLLYLTLEYWLLNGANLRIHATQKMDKVNGMIGNRIENFFLEVR